MKQRIKEFRWVKAKELRPDPRNWRVHPPEQREALRRVMESVGIAGMILARETDDGLVLVDGHLRADLEQELPVAITDLDEDESGVVLSTFDPLASMAKTNTGALEELIEARSGEPETIRLLEEIAADFLPLPDREAEWGGMPSFDNPGEAPYRTIKVHFNDEEAVADFLARLEIDESRLNGVRNFLHWPKQINWRFTTHRWDGDGEEE